MPPYAFCVAYDNPCLLYVPQTQNDLKKAEKFLDTAKIKLILKRKFYWGIGKTILGFVQK